MEAEKGAFYELLRDNEDELAVLRRTYSTFLPHFHRHVEILFVAKGKVNVKVNDTEADLTEGCIAVSDSFDVHRYTDYDGENLFYTLIIPSRYCARFRAALGKKKIADPVIRDPRLCAECIALAEDMKADYGDEFLKQAYIDVVFGKLLKNAKFEERRRNTGADLMREILFYIDENLSSDLSLEKTSRRFGYSAKYFSRLFRASFDCRLGDYVTALRLQRVEGTVREGKGSLENAVFESGFNSIQTFYRAFSARYRTTPRRYFALSDKK